MKQRVYDFLQAHDIAHRVIEHPAVFHVHEHPKELEGLPTTKNLLLKDVKTRQVYMVIMPGEKKLDVRKLAEHLGVSKSRLTFVKFEDVKSTVGVEPGNVSVMNLLHDESKDILVLFDSELHALAEVGAHPNENTATVFMHPTDVVRIARLTGHDVREVSI